MLGIIEASYGNTMIDFSEHVDKNGKLITETGDTLADFLIRELGDTFDSEEKDEVNNLNAVIDAVTKAKEQLESVIKGLEDALVTGRMPPNSASKLL